MIKYCTLASIIATALLSANHAVAQEGQGAEPASGLEEIIITAQRRQEALQRVPLAVSAFSPAQIERKQIVDTYDLVRNIPNLAGNLNVGVGSSSAYYLRGLGSAESIATFDPAVGTYVDDIFISRQNANNFALFDVERIEVLRGPQGTLFGRNTTGGAINIVMRKPSDEFTGFLEAGYGRFNRFSLRGSVDAPISEKILTKFSAFRTVDDGYATQVSTGNRFNNSDSFGLRGALRLLPFDGLTVDLTAEYSDDRSNNFLNIVDPVTGDRIVNNRIIQGGVAPFFTGAKAGYAPGNRAQTTAVTLNIKWDFEAFSLQSISGLRDTYHTFLIDSGGELPRVTRVSGFNPIANEGKHRQYSQELKINGLAFEERLNYTAGLYWIYEDNDTDFGNLATNTTTLVQTVSGDRRMLNYLEAYAAYAQADFKVFPTVTLTAGIRYTDENKSFYIDRNPGAGGSAFSTAGLIAAGIPLEQTQRVWTPRFALAWQATDDIMLFASATRGFKSGGWPARAGAGTANPNTAFVPFAPEKVWSFETGIRADLFERTLRVNLTGFYAHTDDIQIPAQIQTVTGPISSTTNPADLRNKGVELEATWAPIRGLNVDMSLGWQNAEYVNVSAVVQAQQARCKAGPPFPAGLPNCNANFVDRLGNLARPVRTPEITLNAGVSYEFLFGGLSATPNVSVSHTSAYAIGTAGSPDQIDGSWGRDQTSLNAGITLKHDVLPGLSLTVDCRNCTDEVFAVSFIPPFQFLDRPGSWNARLRYKF
jgi:iron complex outermembrane recepter protein